MEKEDKFFLKRMEELASIAERQYRPVFTSFLTLYENSMILSNRRLAPVSIQSWGGYEEAERRLICFSPIDFSIEWEEFPIACIYICPKSRKFSDNLSHRDVLGAVLNLGIEREKTGDILIHGEKKDVWLFCDKKIAGFIEQNLECIKHTRITCKQVNLIEVPKEVVRPNVEVKKGFVSALRLDAVAAEVFHVSRSHMTELIRSEKVFINGRITTENSTIVKENDLISVRKMGKFRFIGTEGESKKGRLFVKIERYR